MCTDEAYTHTNTHARTHLHSHTEALSGDPVSSCFPALERVDAVLSAELLEILRDGVCGIQETSSECTTTEAKLVLNVYATNRHVLSSDGIHRC